MKIRLTCTVFISWLLIAIHAAATQGDADRLRELVVFPDIKLNFGFGMHGAGQGLVVDEYADPHEKLAQLRESLKQQPDDLDRLFQLGDALEEGGNTNEARVCYQHIEKLCRTRIAGRPRDGLSFTRLGGALCELAKPEEAENVFRKATMVSSNEWRCWAGLGYFLGSRAWQFLRPGFQLQYGQMPSPEVLAYRPPPESLNRAEAAIQEASRCYDRAAAPAPREAEVFFQRAGFMSCSNTLECFFRHYRDKETVEPKTWLVAFFPKEMVADLKKAAELEPKDSKFLSLAIYFDFARTVALVGFTDETLPDVLKKQSHDAMAHLEAISVGSDKKAAVEALENLGMLNVMLRNLPVAADQFRRALALDPTREQSWNGLFTAIIESASQDELLAACQARLKAKNSMMNHLILSKQFARMKKWQEAGEQARIAGALDTNNIVPPLMLAALALKQSADPHQLAAAKQNLDRGFKLLRVMPDGEKKQGTRWRELTLDGAIYSALADETENKQQFRDDLNQLLKDSPEDKEAGEILRAL
jgi:tetratricopeptide (TPR) repeat protein